jgi:hypothetical protein
VGGHHEWLDDPAGQPRVATERRTGLRRAPGADRRPASRAPDDQRPHPGRRDRGPRPTRRT